MCCEYNHGAWRHFCRSRGLTQVTLCVSETLSCDFVPEKVSRPLGSLSPAIVVLLRCAVEVLESYVFFSSSPPSEDRLHRFSGQYSQVSLIFEGKRETLAQMLQLGEQ